MRQHLIALALCGSAVHAEPTKREKLDVSDAIGKVDVLRDDTGKYYVMPRVFGDNSDIAEKWTFYGDGRTMHLQRISAFSTDNGNVGLGIWSPRAKGMQHALLERKKDGTTSVICRMQSSKYVRRPLTLLAEDAATKLLKTARFEPVFWERRVLFFGRGEGSSYYLVDMLRDEYGGAGARLFIGPKGQLKPVAISDFASDTGGVAVITKNGELKIDAAANGAAVWKQGKKMVALTRLDPQPNAFLIYRDLGVYGQLGTVCEDQ